MLKWRDVWGLFCICLALIAVLSAFFVFLFFAGSAYLDCMQR